MTNFDDQDLSDLPAPDPKGTIRLNPGGRYRAQSLVHVGDLRIVGDRESAPEIVIGEAPWKLAAETIRMEGVSIRSFEANPASPTPPAAWVSLRCQSVRLESCLIVTRDSIGRNIAAARDRNSQPGALLEWTALSPDELRTTQLSFRNCLFAGKGTAIVSSAAARIEFQNTLSVGGTTLCECEMPGNHLETRVVLDRTTCRQMQAVLRLKSAAAESAVGSAGGILIDTQNCVFDVDPEGGELVELAHPIGPSHLQISGEGSLVPEHLTTIIRSAAADSFDPSAMLLEGLIATPYRFAGMVSLRPVDSEIAECEAPRRSPLPPGIVAADLPSLP